MIFDLKNSIENCGKINVKKVIDSEKVVGNLGIMTTNDEGNESFEILYANAVVLKADIVDYKDD